MQDATTIQATLSQFSGTENYYAHNLPGCPRLKLTDGAHYLREAAECYWLFDIIASVARKLREKDYFHSVKLVKDDKGGATFTADDGNGRIDYAQHIPFTDFPLQTIHLFFQDDVVMLTSEY